MSFPARFLGDIPELRAFRKPMDFLPPAPAEQAESYMADSPGEGAPSLSALAGLGGSSICDFFAPLDIRMLVVEKTRLVCWMEDRIGDKSAGELAVEFAAECVRKMRGSAEVLEALYANFIAGRGGVENPPQAECEFWVVVTDSDSLVRNIRAYNILTVRARGILRAEIDRDGRQYVLSTITDKGKFEKALTRRLPGN